MLRPHSKGDDETDEDTDPQGGPSRLTVAEARQFARFRASQRQEHHEHRAPAIANLGGNDHREEPRANEAGSNATQAPLATGGGVPHHLRGTTHPHLWALT
jgi:hypothetical protein